MATLRITTIKKRDKYPICICISQKGERAYIQTDIFLNDLDEFENGEVVYRKDAKALNKKLLFLFDEYKDKFDKINNGTLSAIQIKNLLCESKTSFTEYWESKIKEFREEGREAYANMNTLTLKHFLSSEGDIQIEYLSTYTVEHFAQWLKKRGYTHGGISMKLSHLKARVNELIKIGILKCDIHPFAHTKLHASAVRECDLPLDDFNKIKDFKLPFKAQLFAKDMFMLSFYMGGINFTDIYQGTFKGDSFSYVRQKSSRKVTQEIIIPILPQAREIIDRYLKGDRLDLGYNFTYRNLQSFINRELKKLGKNIDVDGICFYSSRKSFAQYASELGIPDSVIDYLLGHSDKNRGIIRYYTKVRYKQAEIALKRVVDYANNPEAYLEYLEMRADIMMMK